MKAHIAIHNTLKGSHIPSNSKNNIYSILKKIELLGSRFARESWVTHSALYQWQQWFTACINYMSVLIIMDIYKGVYLHVNLTMLNY